MPPSITESVPFPVSAEASAAEPFRLLEKVMPAGLACSSLPAISSPPLVPPKTRPSLLYFDLALSDWQIFDTETRCSVQTSQKV